MRSGLLEAIYRALGRENVTAIESVATALTETAGDRQSVRVLLAEDSDDNMLLIRSYLKDSRYRVDEVGNGMEAVNKFISGKYHLVLMDVQMPVMGCSAHLTKPIQKALLLKAMAEHTGRRDEPFSEKIQVRATHGRKT